MKHLNGKSVVVTGAGGSIGSALCLRLAAAGVGRLTLVSLTESKLYAVQQQLQAAGATMPVRGVLGSVQDYGLMLDALAGADIVIHAAAHKHIPICEQNPLAAIGNNVGGMLASLAAAARCHVAQFVLISSDKAVRPTSVMGATKRVAELLLARKHGAGAFFAVRFGNVLDTDGSVLPLWRAQVAAGGPVTVTDARCERFFMTIDQACSLVMATVALRPPEGVFVLDMGAPRNMLDMARQVVGASGVDIVFTGLRPGEKLTEELVYGGELVGTVAHGVRRVVYPAGSEGVDAHTLRLLLAAVRHHDQGAALRYLWELVK